MKKKDTLCYQQSKWLSLQISKIASLLTVLICIFISSCKKDSQSPQKQTNYPLTIELAKSAYSNLKSYASSDVFNDIDWTKVRIDEMDGKPYLLIIKSKSDPEKELFYSETNKVPYATWVQFNRGVSLDNEVITVSSISGMDVNQTNYEKGKLVQQKNLKGRASFGNLKEESQASTKRLQSSKSLNETTLALGSDTKLPNSTPDSTISTIAMEDDLPPDIVLLNQVDVYGIRTGINLDVYSLYELLGNTNQYLYRYTTNPSSPNNGAITTVAGTGGGLNKDPKFVKGKSPAIGSAKYLPAGNLVGGWEVDISYKLATVNGVTTVTVDNIAASTSGAISITTSFQSTASTYSISGNTIFFSFTGYDIYGIYGNGYHDSVTINGSYNTSTGTYSIYVTRQ